MYEKINNDKSKNSKILATPKLIKNIFINNKTKVDLREKINNFIRKEEKNSLANTDINSNLTLLENKSNLENMNFDNSCHNNIFHIQKVHQKNEIYGRKKVKRKIVPLNLTDKFNNQNLIICSNHTKKGNFNFSLEDYMNNKSFYNKNNRHIDENLILETKNETKNNIYKKINFYKNFKIKDKNIKIENQKSINLDSKIYNQYSNNTNDNDKNLIKHKSYDLLIKVSLNKNDKFDESINSNKENNNINIRNNEVCHYIKVNKKVINNNENFSKININKDQKNKNDINKKVNDNIIKLKAKNIKKNKIIKDKKDISKIINNKIYYNSELADKYNKANNRATFKKIEKINKYNNNFTNNKNDQIKNKKIKIEKNKLENNIFLDKTYQNRFNKNKNNSNKPLNDIFTNDKQKEYNTFIIKRKNNYLSNMIMNSNNNNRDSINDSKDWVYRLYNKEIKKQKIKDKIILLLRKSILNDENKDNTKKKLEKSKTEKQFKNYKYPVNEGYNVDDNFNIINLFLSDDKKKRKKNISKKKKRIKKCKSFNSHRTKQRKYSFDSNIKEDKKKNKLIDDKIYLKNHRSYKKLRYIYYNEELINEEDEEKEQEKDEDNDEKSV